MGLDEKLSKPDWTTLDFSSTKSLSTDFQWAKIAPTPYRPWHNGPHHVTMGAFSSLSWVAMLTSTPGLRKTEIDDWVEIDNQYLSRYKYKRKLFTERPEDTIQCLPGSENASFEALDYLADFLPRRYPSMFEKTAKGINNLVTGDKWDLRRESKTWDSYHPLQVMGYLSTEDWFIMQTDDDGETTRLKAGANCFPGTWEPPSLAKNIL